MALLEGTNPECDKAPRPMVRWNVQRVRRGLFRRERVEAWVESGFEPDGDCIGFVIWHGTLIRQLSPEQIEELLIATGRDTDPEVVLAKVKWLIKSTTPNVFAYVVDLLKGRLETARADRDRFAETIQELRHNIDLMVVASKRSEQERDWEIKKSERLVRERDEARSDASRLATLLKVAEVTAADAIANGYRSTAIVSADGETIERGDNCFLGTEPERRLILIDCAEAICAENLRVVVLPEGVPVYSKRDNARAWKRSQRNPISSPVGSGAPAVPAMPTASSNGNEDGADTAAGEADLLDFIGVKP